MRPRNGPARVESGPSAEKQDTESNRVAHIVAGDRTRIDGETGVIVWTAADAERVVAFIAACAAKERS